MRRLFSSAAESSRGARGVSCNEYQPLGVEAARTMKEPSALSNGGRRAALATASGLIAVAFAGSILITPLYALFREEFGFSKVMLTLIYAAYALGNLGALFFFGRLSDQLGRKRVGLLALGLAALSALLFLFARDVAWLFAARVVSGLAVGVASGTGAAWLAELYPPEQRPRATVAAILANLIGVAFGPLISGLLGQYAPWPLQLSFLVYLAIVIAIAVLIVRARETIASPIQSLRRLQLRPRVGIPAQIRAQFIAPALTAFAGFALAGFYFALIPGILSEALNEKNIAVGGGVVFEMAVGTVLAVFLTRRLRSSSVMFAGLLLLIPSVAALVLAEALKSMTILLLGTALAGVAIGLGYRGSLQIANAIAPADRRAEVLSSYYIACFIGNSVPIIGEGIVASYWNSLIASAAFACTIAGFAVVALIAGKRYAPQASADQPVQ
jgi:MFS family permease